MENWILILLIIVLPITLLVGILVYKKEENQGIPQYYLNLTDTVSTKDGWLLSCNKTSANQIDTKNKMANLGCLQSYKTPTFYAYCSC
jgi:hypothetical protein